MSEDVPLQTRTFGNEGDAPRLLVTAGVHGDEPLPVLALRELIRRFESESDFHANLHGHLTLIPVANRPAFQLGHRRGPDDRDLARTCPGREDGGPTERIAFALSREIEATDCYVDLHTGGTELCVFPLAGYVLHPDAALLEKQRAIARAFGLPFLWGTAADLPGRTLSVARDAGVPAIYVEYLGSRREHEEVARNATGDREPDHPLVAGCLDVMRHLGMLPGRVEIPVEFEVAEDRRPGSGHMQVCHPAPATGRLTLSVELGQRVRPGGVLATIAPEDDAAEHLVCAEHGGKVVVLRDDPHIDEGDAVAVVAEPAAES